MMTRVVATHAVGDMDTWLGGGDKRKEIFATFSASYRTFRHVDQNRVTLVFEGVDLEKMKAVLGSPEAAESKAKHTVIDPIEVYVEIDGGT